MHSLGNVYIIGDSLSTYFGVIPADYAAYYGRPDPVMNGVDTLEKMWWHQVITATGSTLVMDDAYSGTTVSYSGYDNKRCDASFVARSRQHLQNGMCNGLRVDTVLLMPATNDNGANSPIGDYQYAAWSEADLDSFLPAFACLLDHLTSQGVRVINIINTDLRPAYTDGMLTITAHYGVENIILHDIDKINWHFTDKGMRQVAEQVLQALER